MRFELASRLLAGFVSGTGEPWQVANSSDRKGVPNMSTPAEPNEPESNEPESQDSAEPESDEPKSKSNARRNVVILVLLVVFIGGCTALTSMFCGPSEEEKAEERRRGLHCLNKSSLAWDSGKQIQERMLNPDSYEEVQASIGPVTKDGIHVYIIKFRGTNVFGATIQQEAIFRVTQDGCEGELLRIKDIN